MNLIEKDLQNVWHPYTQMKLAKPPIPIVKAEGVYLFTENGDRYVDAIASWWVNTHGHSHPHIAKKIYEQAMELEHVIFANFTHPRAVELSERLLKILPKNQSKVFFSDNGSTAVEVAIKMAMQYWYNKNEKRSKIIAIDGAYHGDTFGAMSVSGKSAFNDPFRDGLFDVMHIPFPEEDGSESLSQLEKYVQRDDIAAFIFEPLVQGAAGMRMYSAEILSKMMNLCKQHNVLTIADEVMTGFGRTGKYFATDHVSENPDIICLSKGLTGGTMPLGITTATQEIFDAFLSDDKMKTFFHGHSFTANPIACACACASLDLFDEPQTWENIDRIGKQHQLFKAEIENHKRIQNVVQWGTIIAIELKTDEDTSYFNSQRDQIYDFFMERNILLRPLGNIIYILPPYCISKTCLEEVYEAIKAFLNE